MQSVHRYDWVISKSGIFYLKMGCTEIFELKRLRG